MSIFSFYQIKCRNLSGAKIVNTDQKNQIGEGLKADLILSFQRTANAHVNALVTNGIHGIRKTIGSVLTENQELIKRQ